MKISLISPYSSILSLGLRSISAVLRQAGFDTRVIFLPISGSESSLPTSPYFQMSCPEPLLRELADLTADSAVIGLSLMDNYAEVGAQLTKALKRKDNLVVWGGVYPTINPEEALAQADAVCIGDGEYALLELVNQLSAGKAVASIPNLWFKGEPYPRLEAIEDISVFPLPDYGPEGHFIYREAGQRLMPLSSFDDYRDLLERAPGPDGRISPVFMLETTRGCPHNCTFCMNNVLKKLQTPKLRFKSVEQIRRELVWVRKNLPFVETISIEDDTFIVRKDIRDISLLFKELGFPFRCLISPQHVTEELIDFLWDCGLFACQVGMQSRAPRIEAMYNRSLINQKSDQLFDILRRKHPDLTVCIDLLVNNPWERTDESLFTLRYLLDTMPPKAILGVNSLILYRGTKLWEQARQDNLLDDYSHLRTWHWHRQENIRYTTLLFAMLKAGVPRGLVRFLSSGFFVALFERELFVSGIFPGTARLTKKVARLFRR